MCVFQCIFYNLYKLMCTYVYVQYVHDLSYTCVNVTLSSEWPHTWPLYINYVLYNVRVLIIITECYQLLLSSMHSLCFDTLKGWPPLFDVGPLLMLAPSVDIGPSV